MTTTKRMLFVSLIMAMSAMMAVAQSNDADAAIRDKITNAVMKVYDDQLAKDPNDYNTLFARAHQHYYNGEYTAALADVNQALLLTPKKDHELRFDEHILRARISEARQDYASELADLRLAQELQPKSLACTDMIAKANLKAGNLDAAEKAFKKILHAESMNYDAMYGLALVEQQRNNPKAAIEQVDKAVKIFRAEPQVYVNRADIFMRQGDVNSALQDLLVGMSVGDGGTAAQRLFDLSDSNYDEVMRSLADLANRTNDSGMYRYLRASIAMDHCHYGQALRDLYFVKRNHLYDGSAVYYNIAKCCVELARFDEALIHVDQAIEMSPQEPEYYIVKALAEFNAGEGGNYSAAMQALNRCSAFAPQYVPMLLTKAHLLINQGKDKDGLGYLNAAIANEPTNAEALFTRAMYFKRHGDANLLSRDLRSLTLLSDDVVDLKGFAFNEQERDNEAFNWLSRVTSANQPGGENYYYAAVFMALKGDDYNAMDYLQKALDKGYGSLYNLKYNVLSPLTLQSLREKPNFTLLVDKAQRNFIESE